jgi:uncharacterized membrane protein YkvA (DUF1232 family)
MARSKAPKRQKARTAPLLSPSDFISYLFEKSEQLAPGDLQQVVGLSDDVQRHADKVKSEHPRLSRHVELAFQIVRDHDAGQCPQIPYYTVSLLTVALLYFLDPLDVIPDWIEGAGSADDALIFELAFGLGRAGIERYCTWKSISTDGLLLPPKPAKAPAAKRRKPRR